MSNERSSWMEYGMGSDDVPFLNFLLFLKTMLTILYLFSHISMMVSDEELGLLRLWWCINNGGLAHWHY
jgi:hypothetical protein